MTREACSRVAATTHGQLSELLTAAAAAAASGLPFSSFLNSERGFAPSGWDVSASEEAASAALLAEGAAAESWDGQVPRTLLFPPMDAALVFRDVELRRYREAGAVPPPAWMPEMPPPVVRGLHLPRWDVAALEAAAVLMRSPTVVPTAGLGADPSAWTAMRRRLMGDEAGGVFANVTADEVANEVANRTALSQGLVADLMGAAPEPAAAAAAASALHVFAITSDYFTYSCEFLRSAVLNGLVPHIIGFDARLVAEDRAKDTFNWGLGKPLLWLRPALLALQAAAGPRTLVMLADAHDTLVLAPAATIAARFRALLVRRPGTRVVVTAERSCFPISDEECARFPRPRELVPCSGLAYPHLNSGALMGEVAHVLAVLADIDAAHPAGLEAERVNDQAAMQLAFLDPARRERLGLALDYTNALFIAMHMSCTEVGVLGAGGPNVGEGTLGGTWAVGENPCAGSGVAAPAPAEGVLGETPAPPPWRLCNTVTGGCPALAHFNGGSKARQALIDAALFTSRVTEDLEAGRTDDAHPGPLVEALDNYLVGGIEMTVRDFCCAGEWTTTRAQPGPRVAQSRPGTYGEERARPAWLRCG